MRISMSDFCRKSLEKRCQEKIEQGWEVISKINPTINGFGRIKYAVALRKPEGEIA